MKYLITEEQFNRVNEIYRKRGRYITEPLEDFFSEIEQKMKGKKFITAFKKYFTKIGQNIDNLEDSQILLYFDELPRYTRGGYILKSFFYEKDVVAGFAYYLAKKYFDLKEGQGGLQYIVFEANNRAYFFFDPNFKIFVGGIGLERKSRFSGKSFKVMTSAVEKELIGGGYGLKMYLTIIDDVDYLLSSNFLFTGSLRMWKDVLPKYVNVWVQFDEHWEMIVPGKKYNLDNIKNFVASSYHDTL